MQIYASFGSSTSLSLPRTAFFAPPSICYLAGRFLVRSYSDHTQVFQPLKDRMQYHGFAVSPDRERVICHRSEQGVHQLAMYSLTEVAPARVIKHPEVDTLPIKCVQFRKSNEIVVLYEGKENGQIAVIGLEEGLSYSPVKTYRPLKEGSYIKVSNNPTFFSLAGRNALMVLKVDQQDIYMVENIYTKLFAGREIGTHCWMCAPYEKCMLVYLTVGNILMVSMDGESKCEFGTMMNTLNHYSICQMVMFRRQILLASSNCYFAIWEINEELNADEIIFKKKCSWTIGEERGTTCLGIDISDSHQQLLVALANNDIATIKIPSSEPVTARFEYLYRGSHNGPIQSLDVCRHFPFALTCSRKDNTIRLWNILSQDCRLLRQFAYKEKDAASRIKNSAGIVFSGALHPVGLYAAVALAETVSFFYVMKESLRPYKQLYVKGICLDIKFSNGGQFLAIIVKKQNPEHYLCMVYRSFQMTCIYSTKLSTDSPNQLFWTEDDDMLFVTGKELLFCWGRTWQNYIKMPNWQLHSLTTWQACLFIGCTNNGKNNLSIARISERSIQIVNSFEVQQKLLSLACANRDSFLYAGTSSGHLLGFKPPFSGTFAFSMPLMTQPIVRLSLTKCESMLLAGGENGLIMVLQDEREIITRQTLLSSDLSGVALYEISEIQKHKQNLRELKAELEVLESRLVELALDDHKKILDEKQQIKSELEKECNYWQDRFKELKALKNQAESESLQKIKHIEHYNTEALQEIEEMYSRRIIHMQEEKIALQSLLDTERQHFQSQLQQLRKDHKSELAVLSAEHKTICDELRKEKEMACAYVLELQDKLDSMEDNLLEKHEQKISRLISQHKMESDNKERECQHFSAEFEYQRTKARQLNSQLIVLKDNQQIQLKRDQLILKQNQRLLQLVKAKEVEIAEAEKVIKQQSIVIKEWEIKDWDSKKMLQNSQIHKEHLLKELKGMEKVKREESMLRANQSQQLEQLCSKLSAQEKTTVLSRKEIRALQQELQHLTFALKREQTHRKKVVGQLVEMVRESKNDKDRGRNARYLAEKYSNGVEIKETYDHQKESIRQVFYMQRQLSQMKGQLEKHTGESRKEMQQRVKQNTFLINSLNKIRKEYKLSMITLQEKNKRLQEGSNAEVKKSGGLNLVKKRTRSPVEKRTKMTGCKTARAGLHKFRTLHISKEKWGELSQLIDRIQN